MKRCSWGALFPTVYKPNLGHRTPWFCPVKAAAGGCRRAPRESSKNYGVYRAAHKASQVKASQGEASLESGAAAGLEMRGQRRESSVDARFGITSQRRTYRDHFLNHVLECSDVLVRVRSGSSTVTEAFSGGRNTLG